MHVATYRFATELMDLDLKELISTNLKTLRGKRYTQEKLAEIAGIPPRTYINIEGGNSWPELANIEAIAGVLGIKEATVFADPSLVIKAPRPTPIEALKIIEEAVKRAEVLSTSPQKRLLIEQILARTTPFEDAEIQGLLAIITLAPPANASKPSLDKKDDHQDSSRDKLSRK